jgi:hypothetical protein
MRVRQGQKHEVRHEAHGVARRPMFAGLLIVLLVEAADQFLEHRAHGMVVEAGQIAGGLWGEIDVLVEKLLDELAQRVGFGEARDLVAEFEVG